MPITILSPYSGRPVKVRDQDLGRAIRDEEGRIFYVIPRSDGQGHYAAPTRKGSEKDEQRYRDLERKTAEQGEIAREVQQQPAHDATGPGRPVSPVRLIVLLIVLLAAIAAGLWLLLDIDITPLSPDEPAPVPVQPTEPADSPQSGWIIEGGVAYSFEPMMITIGQPACVTSQAMRLGET
ncbi:hypothetical protein ACERK3_10260 [Phycisphaerales bacterium AB-hyl4]|uniref:Uncharacterized protein n=1 Tax=Natronomicrosphaera hydrolytica TaxID=3242702 RepID=A0ABV4U781_9BACT